MFPRLHNRVSLIDLSILLSTTRIVGVFCPGLNSLYSELKLFRTENTLGAQVQYAVDKYYENINLLKLIVNAPDMKGEIKSFIRKTPQEQLSYEEVTQHVKHNEFCNQKALIVGGSRGLGEIASKILAAGGADVILTYAKGFRDANHIVAEVNKLGGKARCIALDLMALNEDILEGGVGNEITHLYFFATPFIETSNQANLRVDLLTNFIKFYVDHFYTLVNSPSMKGVKRVFYPSSGFIDDLPSNLKEYVIAKMAGELAGQYLMKNNSKLKIYSPRLQKMNTDQTVELFQNKIQDPFPVLLKELRLFNVK